MLDIYLFIFFKASVCLVERGHAGDLSLVVLSTLFQALIALEYINLLVLEENSCSRPLVESYLSVTWSFFTGW